MENEKPNYQCGKCEAIGTDLDAIIDGKCHAEKPISMISILFSHEYYKTEVAKRVWSIDTHMPFSVTAYETPSAQTWLVGVAVEDIDKLPQCFLDSDTIIAVTNKYYALGRGKHIILLLFTKEPSEKLGMTWQTIRRWTPEKEEYYKKHVGEEVKIVIEEEEEET